MSLLACTAPKALHAPAKRQKAVPFFMLRGGVWRATPDTGKFHSAGPRALDFPSMARPGTGRGDEEARRQFRLILDRRTPLQKLRLGKGQA